MVCIIGLGTVVDTQSIRRYTKSSLHPFTAGSCSPRQLIETGISLIVGIDVGNALLPATRDCRSHFPRFPDHCSGPYILAGMVDFLGHQFPVKSCWSLSPRPPAHSRKRALRSTLCPYQAAEKTKYPDHAREDQCSSVVMTYIQLILSQILQ